jgi:hypothetical protein
MRGNDRGQVTPLVAVAVIVLALTGMGVAKIGLAAAVRARARTAADAAALAGAAGGRAEAEALAQDNGATMVGFRQEGTDVVVKVQVGGAEATARARRDITTHAR